MSTRCAITPTGVLGCCREEGHGGDCCAHPVEQLTSTPGKVLNGDGALTPWGTPLWAFCGGDLNPVRILRRRHDVREP
jgi:hypothetical protein